MSFEQIKRTVAWLDQYQLTELISFTLQFRYAQDASFHREATARLNDQEPLRWLTLDKFERRLDLR